MVQLKWHWVLTGCPVLFFFFSFKYDYNASLWSQRFRGAPSPCPPLFSCWQASSEAPSLILRAETNKHQVKEKQSQENMNTHLASYSLSLSPGLLQMSWTVYRILLANNILHSCNNDMGGGWSLLHFYISGLVIHTFHLSTLETEIGKSLWVQSLHSGFQNNKS